MGKFTIKQDGLKVASGFGIRINTQFRHGISIQRLHQYYWLETLPPRSKR